MASKASTQQFNDEESACFLDEKLPEDSKGDWRSEGIHPAWALLAFILFQLVYTCVFITAMIRWDERHIMGSTDLPDARSAIHYERRKFTGALVYDEETKRAVRLRDAPIEFFGPPGETDGAWDDLLRGEFVEMTEEEAEPFLPELRTLPPKHVYRFEPDVFHSLHCLNAIRIEMSKVLYPNSTGTPHHHALENVKLPPGWDIAHMEHCMDRIRQALMCHGDLTPSPLYRWDGFNLAFGRTGEHFCRKWEPIREWMDERKRRDEERHQA